MVLIELVYCKITGKTRSLPKIHHFVPLEPWSCRKIKGKKRVMNIDQPHDQPKSAPRRRWKGPKKKEEDQIKLVLDMSSDGPTFKQLESLMAAAAAHNDDDAFEALGRLLRSGIPGMEALLAGNKNNQTLIRQRYRVDKGDWKISKQL